MSELYASHGQREFTKTTHYAYGPVCRPPFIPNGFIDTIYPNSYGEAYETDQNTRGLILHSPDILLLSQAASSPERGSNKRLKVARCYSPGRVYDDVVTLLKIEIYEEDTREESKVHM